MELGEVVNNFGGLANMSVGSLLIITVAALIYALMTGKLIALSTYKSILEERDGWKSIALKQIEVNRALSRTAETLTETGRVAQHVFESLPTATGAMPTVADGTSAEGVQG